MSSSLQIPSVKRLSILQLSIMPLKIAWVRWRKGMKKVLYPCKTISKRLETFHKSNVSKFLKWIKLKKQWNLDNSNNSIHSKTKWWWVDNSTHKWIKDHQINNKINMISIISNNKDSKDTSSDFNFISKIWEKYKKVHF